MYSNLFQKNFLMKIWNFNFKNNYLIRDMNLKRIINNTSTEILFKNIKNVLVSNLYINHYLLTIST